MSVATYTTADLLNEIRFRGNFPDTSNNSSPTSSTNLLKIASSELNLELLDMIMKTRSEFYVTDPYDVAITANQAEYQLPERAAAQVVRDIQIIRGNQVDSLEPIDPDYIRSLTTGNPHAYYFRHNFVVLHPTPANTEYTLRIRYHRRPSILEETSNCAQISSINTGTNTVTVSSIPSTWVTGTILDIIQARSPFAALAVDQASTTISGTDITFASLPSNLAMGDWLAPIEKTPIPQIPIEFMPILALRTVLTIMDSQGDYDGAKAALAKLKAQEKAALTLITPRNRGERKKIVQRNWRLGRGIY